MQPTGAPNDPHPDGEDAHGTACAGIAGAVTYNEVGIAGVAATARIMPLQMGYTHPIFGSPFINTHPDWWIGCMNFAVNNGADVVSMSVGLDSDIDFNNAMANAVNNGVVLVASSGNSGASSISYPASNPNVIAVGASLQDDTRWPGSQYGSNLDLVAPGGVSIWSTDRPGNIGYTDNDYVEFGGTSAAAPHVAGVAALIKSLHPNITPSQIRTILRNSADNVPGMGGQNFHNEYGYGRLNAFRALTELFSIINPSIVCNTNTSFSLGSLPPGSSVTWTKSGNLTYVSGQGTANYTVKATGLTTSGEGWVQATITGECGTVVLRKDVWVGIPQKPSHIVFVPHTPCTNQFVLAYFNEINPPISQVYYQWSSGDHVFFPQGESSTWFQTKGPLAYTTNVHVSAQNICGSNILTQLLTVQECGGGGIPPVPPASDPETPLLVISPNPASDYIDVSINNVSQQLQGNEVYVMTIYDRFSQVVRNVTTDVPHVRIPVYNLPTGTYVLSVVSSDQVRLHGKFIIQR